MAPPLKYTQVIAIIKQRIREGDYLLRDLPGERRIAAEVGVSYMTARKAVGELINQQVLARESGGKLVVNAAYLRQASDLHIRFVVPAYPSDHFNECQFAITQSAAKHGAAVRLVHYVHWDDPVFNDLIDESGGTLIIPNTVPPPPRLLKRLRDHEGHVAIFDGDFTDHGVPSIHLRPDAHIELCFEHLWALGHRHIDLMNTQGHNEEVDRRIARWEHWAESRNIDCRRWEDSAPPYTDPRQRAYKLANRMLRTRGRRATAVVCTTEPAAMGLMRACYEQGIAVGQDLSVSSISVGSQAGYLCPALTGLQMPDLDEVLSKAFGAFRKGSWPKTLLLQPRKAVFLKGESTGPVAPDRL